MKLAKDTIEGCDVVNVGRGYEVRNALGDLLGTIDKRARHELRWSAKKQLGTASTWGEAVRAIKTAHGGSA